MSPQGYKNMDLESQDPIFNDNLGQDENLIWTKKLRCSHSMSHDDLQSVFNRCVRLVLYYKMVFLEMCILGVLF